MMINAVCLAVCHTVADMADASGPILPDGNRVTLASVAAVADQGAVIQTTVNRSDSLCGGCEYEVKTLAQHRVDIGDAGWVPDGDLNHYLFGGTTLVAVAILINSKLPLSILGVVYDNSTNAAKFCRIEINPHQV